MKLQLNISLFIFTISMMLSSCAEPTTSGPCDYTEERFKMHIMDVRPNPENEDLMVVDVDFDGNIDWVNASMTLNEVLNFPTDTNFIKHYKIKPGNIYTGSFHQKVENSGNCTDYYIGWDQKLNPIK